MVVGASVGGKQALSGKINDVPTGNSSIVVEFTGEVTADEASLRYVAFTGGDLTVSAGEDAAHLVFTPVTPLFSLRKYTFRILGGEVFGVNLVEDYTLEFTTGYDTSDKFSRIPDEELLTLVQKQTFKYFSAEPLEELAFAYAPGEGDTGGAVLSGFAANIGTMLIFR